MKFFIDTANLDQIREAQALGVLDGVTTNPSLMAKEGITGEKNIIQHYVDICARRAAAMPKGRIRGREGARSRGQRRRKHTR